MKVELKGGVREISPNFEPPVVKRDCCHELTEISGRDENTPLKEGVYLYDYVATDYHGHSKSCKFQVDVWSKQNPAWIGCPNVKDDSLKAKVDGKIGGAFITWDEPNVEFSGNISQHVQVNSSVLRPGFLYPPGKMKVVYTAQVFDPTWGYELEPVPCEFEVEVIDVTANGKPAYVHYKNLDHVVESGSCQDGEEGVGMYVQCGGKRIVTTKSVPQPHSFNSVLHKEYKIEDVDFDCCGDLWCGGSEHFKKCT